MKKLIILILLLCFAIPASAEVKHRVYTGSAAIAQTVIADPPTRARTRSADYFTVQLKVETVTGASGHFYVAIRKSGETEDTFLLEDYDMADLAASSAAAGLTDGTFAQRYNYSIGYGDSLYISWTNASSHTYILDVGQGIDY